MWIVTKDWGYSEMDKEMGLKSRVGTRSKDCSWDVDVNDIKAIKKLMPIRWRTLDDDGNVYHEGYYNGVKSVETSRNEKFANIEFADIELQRKWFDTKDDYMSNLFRETFPDGSEEDFAFSPLYDLSRPDVGAVDLQLWVTGKGGGWKTL